MAGFRPGKYFDCQPKQCLSKTSYLSEQQSVKASSRGEKLQDNTLNSRLLRISKFKKSFLILREKFKTYYRIRTLFSVI